MKEDRKAKGKRHDARTSGNAGGVLTLEAIVDHGRIQLKGNVRLPDKTKVYVIVPALHVEQTTHIATPRLAHPEQATDFEMEIIEVSSNARL
jgi:hypothetical protein